MVLFNAFGPYIGISVWAQHRSGLPIPFASEWPKVTGNRSILSRQFNRELETQGVPFPGHRIRPNPATQRGSVLSTESGWNL
jgi:hypothetical protein